MTTSAITFDQMERSADRALAVVLWAKHVKNVAEGTVLFVALNKLLHSLVHSLSRNEKLNSLSDEQAKELATSLTDLYDHLASMLDQNGLILMRRNSLFKGSIDGIEQSAEDLRDIIHDLKLSYNQDFRAIVADCVTSISSAHPVEPVGRM
jgi:signal transduction histidine kinase